MPDGSEHKESQRMEGETVMAVIERDRLEKAELSAEGKRYVHLATGGHSRSLFCLETLDHVQTTCLARLQREWREMKEACGEMWFQFSEGKQEFVVLSS